MPFVIRNFLSTQKPDRMVPPRGPEWKTCRRRQPFDHVRTRRFLKNHEIRRSGFYNFRKRLLATHSTESDVVTE